MVVKFEKKEGTTLFMKKEEALSKFEDLMIFQYGDKAESDLAFNRLTEDYRSTPTETKNNTQ